MEELKEILSMIEKLPGMTLWVLGGFAVYKLLTYASTVTAVTMILRLAIDKIHDAYRNPRPVTPQEVQYKIRDRFISEDVYQRFEGLITKLRFERRLSPEYVGTRYIHESDLDFLLLAYEEKKQRDKK